MAIIFCVKMLSTLLIFLLLSTSIILADLTFERLLLPSNTIGPVSFAFDKNGGGPYLGTSNGMVLNYAPGFGFADFAASSTESITGSCQMRESTIKEDLDDAACGRPLGLAFDNLGNKLYIADAYHGLLVVNIDSLLPLPFLDKGDLARRSAIKLCSSAEGVPFRFLSGLDVDLNTGMVYFTDAGSVHGPRDMLDPGPSSDATGRLLKYNPHTKEVSVLLTRLGLAYGTAVSENGKFVLVSEYAATRIQKYWLKGPKANTAENIGFNMGAPVNIRRTKNGNFWVAVNDRYQQISPGNPWLTIPTGVLIDSVGNVLGKVSLMEEYNESSITEVLEVPSEALYVASPNVDYVGTFKI